MMKVLFNKGARLLKSSDFRMACCELSGFSGRMLLETKNMTVFCTEWVNHSRMRDDCKNCIKAMVYYSNSIENDINRIKWRTPQNWLY